jgi:hypothetical protein
MQTNAGQAKKDGFVIPQVLTEGFFVNHHFPVKRR